MFFALFSVILSASAIPYEAGETFSYVYSSNMETSSAQEGRDDNKLNFDINCTANFRVLSVTENSANMELKVTNAKGHFAQDKTSQDLQSDDNVQVLMSLPITFTIFDNATITNVVADKTDTSEIVTYKTSIAYSLRAHLDATEDNFYTNEARIDNLGQHYELVRISRNEKEKTRTIEASYTENDFVQFESPNADASISGLDIKTVHQISASNKVLSVTGFTNLFMNKESQNNANSNDDAPTKLFSKGSFSLSNFKAGPKQVANAVDETADLEAYLRANPNKVLVPHLHPSFYLQRTVAKTEPVPSNDVPETCPEGVDFCRSIPKKWTVGNSDCGATISFSAMAGTTLGCKSESRSYMAGAYGSIDISIISHSVNAVDAYAEIGVVNGSPLKNAVAASLFGNTVFKKEFPWTDCMKHTWNIGHFNHTWEFTITWRIYCFEIDLTLGVGLDLNLDLTATVCILDLKAQVQLVPRAAVSVSASADVSIYVARAGISITGTVADHLNPTVYVDGNVCRVGFYLYNIFEGVDLDFSGWWQVIDLWGSFWHWHREWGSKHSISFYSHHWSGREDKIVDIYWGAK